MATVVTVAANFTVSTHHGNESSWRRAIWNYLQASKRISKLVSFIIKRQTNSFNTIHPFPLTWEFFYSTHSTNFRMVTRGFRRKHLKINIKLRLSYAAESSSKSCTKIPSVRLTPFAYKQNAFAKELVSAYLMSLQSWRIFTHLLIYGAHTYRVCLWWPTFKVNKRITHLFNLIRQVSKNKQNGAWKRRERHNLNQNLVYNIAIFGVYYLHFSIALIHI